MVPRIFPRLFPFVIADAGIGIARRPFLGLIVAPPQRHVSTRPITGCEASWYAVELRCALDLLALRRPLDFSWRPLLLAHGSVARARLGVLVSGKSQIDVTKSGAVAAM